VALFGYFEGGKRLPEPRGGNILCAAFDIGWFWYIPLSPTLTSVGAVLGREHAREILQHDDRETALAHFIDACPLIKDHLAEARRVTEGPYGEVRVRRDWSYAASNFWVPGMVLLGDAAGFIDPLFSQGVHLATYSALLAARSINTCLAGPDIPEAECFAEYEFRYRKEYKVFYDFLSAFYDMQKSEDSYFWDARKILNSPDRANEAFVNLVAGTSSAAGDFFGIRTPVVAEEAAGEAPAELATLRATVHTTGNELELQALAGSGLPPEHTGSGSGLVRSGDGFHWRREPAG
jgi:halogenation protein CepH